MSAQNKTYCCPPQCVWTPDASWTQRHDSSVLTFVIAHGGGGMKRQDFQEYGLASLVKQLHETHPGQCFSKEFVLQKFSKLVLRFNAWTYLTRLEGVRIYPVSKSVHVPSVLQPGIAQVRSMVWYICIRFYLTR